MHRVGSWLALSAPLGYKPRMLKPYLAVAALFALTGAVFGTWASRIPVFKARFDLNEAELGLLLLCLAGGSILAFPLAGRLMDRFGSAGVSKWLAILCLPSLIGIALAPTPVVFAAALGVFGAVMGATDVTMNGWGARLNPVQRAH